MLSPLLAQETPLATLQDDAPARRELAQLDEEMERIGSTGEASLEVVLTRR